MDAWCGAMIAVNCTHVDESVLQAQTMNVSQKFFMMSFDWRYCCLVNDHGFCSYNQASKDFFKLLF